MSSLRFSRFVLFFKLLSLTSANVAGPLPLRYDSESMADILIAQKGVKEGGGQVQVFEEGDLRRNRARALPCLISVSSISLPALPLLPKMLEQTEFPINPKDASKSRKSEPRRNKAKANEQS